MSITLSYDLSQIEAIAHQLLTYRTEYSLYCFVGNLGLGKTTLIKSILRQTGIDNRQMSSPSFPIINEYKNAQSSEKIYHIDLYRLERLEELSLLDLDEYFANHFCLVEWPKFSSVFRTYPHLWIEIQPFAMSETQRYLHIHFNMP